MAMLQWTHLPSGWIEKKGLKRLTWTKAEGSDNVAALMVLMVVAQHADSRTGIARLTYDFLTEITGLSRAKVSAGLRVIEECGIITRRIIGRSSIQLTEYDPTKAGWAKLPTKGLYSAGRIRAFDDFHLRSVVELDALKLYFLFVSRRGVDTNRANLSYVKITEYSGVHPNRIRAAVSRLVNANMVQVEYQSTDLNESAVSAAYRLSHLEPRRHMGTNAGMKFLEEET